MSLPVCGICRRNGKLNARSNRCLRSTVSDAGPTGCPTRSRSPRLKNPARGNEYWDDCGQYADNPEGEQACRLNKSPRPPGKSQPIADSNPGTSAILFSVNELCHDRCCRRFESKIGSAPTGPATSRLFPDRGSRSACHASRAGGRRISPRESCLKTGARTSMSR
jgi:hypothetical protein